MTRAEALKAAKTAIALMGSAGAGFKPYVWSNNRDSDGVHASIISACGRIRVFINPSAVTGEGNYTASLCENRWWSQHEDNTYATPNDAIVSVINVALADLRNIEKLTEGLSNIALAMYAASTPAPKTKSKVKSAAKAKVSS